MNEENKEEETPLPWMADLKQYTFDSEKRKEKIFRDTVHYLTTDERIQTYFQHFNADSIASFIGSYAWAKCLWMFQNEQIEHALESELLGTQNDADKCLGNILQKKLFNKQCEWRANQFKHPAVQTIADFRYWEENILNCPFLEPITQQEVDLYIEFLNSYTGENLGFLCGWQAYDTYNSNAVTVGKTMHPPDEETDEDDEEGGSVSEDETEGEQHKDVNSPRLMPPWYIFYDERMGTGHYLLLPDHRKKKEIAYWGLGNEEAAEKVREEWKTNPPDKRPYFSINTFDVDEMTNMIRQLETDPEVLRAYLDHKKYLSNPGKINLKHHSEVLEAWQQLVDCTEPFPMVNTAADWKEALVATANLWKRTKLIRALPAAYEEYLMRLDAGLEQPYGQFEVQNRKGKEIYNEYVLRGRELKGEPRDFNF